MTRRPHHRGLTLVEMMLALAVTALVAGAIAGMMSAVSAGVGARRDARSAMIRANLASIRLNGYAAPARALIDVEDERFALWFNDDRPGGTVHVSEVRWFEFDALAGEIIVKYVSFPAEWSEVQKNLQDVPYAATANWWLILTELESRGYIREKVIVDGLLSVRFECETTDLNSHIISAAIELDSEDSPYPVRITATIRNHQPPSV